MKHYIFILLSLLLLASCNEQDISGGSGTTGTDGSGLRLSVRLSSGVATRALGDPFASGKEEKRIDRLAFFVHTAEDGFQVYPPVPDDVTDPDVAAADHPNAVYLSGTPDDGYEATVALTAGGGYVADIIAIANLPADYDYNQIVTWQGLCDSVALHAATMPACLPGSAETDKAARNAFVMYGDIRKELKKEETNALSFVLQRLVARIDITNEAYVSGTIPDNAATGPANSFFLTSARLLHAQPAAFVVPKPDVTPDVVTTSDWAPITGIGTEILYGKPTTKTPATDPTQEPEAVAVTTADDAKAATLQYAWHTLYTYPNSDTEHAPTALEIKGTFRGTEITRQIPFVDKEGNAFPVAGNHRYLVRIVKAPGQTDITFDIKVSEWDAVDTVQVKPDQTLVPVITNLVTNATEYINADGQTAYDLYYTQDGEMTFEATCPFSPGIRVKYYNDRTGKWTTEGDWLTVEQSEEELIPDTRATSVYKRSYKVSFTKFDGGLTRKAMLLVHNGGSEVECDTILVRHVVTYPGTDYDPIACDKRDDGTDIIWAPVNVGATRIATDLSKYIDLRTNGDIHLGDVTDEDIADVFAQCGYYYQWGRNVPFKWGADLDLVDLKNEELQKKYADACQNKGLYADKFLFTAFSWFSDYETANEWPHENQPCPAGWCVPTADEMNKLVEKTVTVTNGVAFVDNAIYIPCSGSIHAYGGRTLTFIIGSDLFYLATQDGGLLNVFSYNKTENRLRMVIKYTGSALPVRCIQNAP